MTKELNYRELQAELTDILDRLQTGDLDVDEASKLYERGMYIAKQLEAYLKTAENTVTKLKQRFEA